MLVGGSEHAASAGAIALIQSQGAASELKCGANDARDAGRSKNSEAFIIALWVSATVPRNAGNYDVVLK